MRNPHATKRKKIFSPPPSARPQDGQPARAALWPRAPFRLPVRFGFGVRFLFRFWFRILFRFLFLFRIRIQAAKNIFPPPPAANRGGLNRCSFYAILKPPKGEAGANPARARRREAHARPFPLSLPKAATSGNTIEACFEKADRVLRQVETPNRPTLPVAASAGIPSGRE